MKCEYCPPFYENYQVARDVIGSDLSRAAVLGSADAGITTFRLSGGEPLLRVQEVVGVATALTNHLKRRLVNIRLNTNGSRLSSHLDELVRSGIDVMKISVDTLDPDLFAEITGSRKLPEILASIERAAAMKVHVEINMVYAKKTASSVWPLIDYCVKNGLPGLKVLDLVEYDDPQYFRDNYVSPSGLVEELRERYGTPVIKGLSTGRGVPMLEFQVNSRTKVLVKDCTQGTTYSESYCAGCPLFPCQEGFYNLTLNSDGKLKPCRLVTGNYTDLRAELDENPDMARSQVSEIVREFLQTHYSGIYSARLWQPSGTMADRGPE